MPESYLLFGPTKRKFKKGTKIIYLSEFSQKLYFDAKLNGACKTSYLINSDKPAFFKKDLGFIKEKVSKYLSDLTVKLNIQHKSKLNEKYWGILLENYLMHIACEIFINQKIIKKNKKKLNSTSFIEEKIYIEKSSSVNFFLNNIITSKNFSKFIKSKIVTSYFSKSKKKFKYIYLNYKSNKKRNYFQIILRTLIKFYIKIFKPVVILNPYFGKNNSLKLIFKSLGKILILDRKFLLFSFLEDFKKNHISREKIQIKENDEFDKVFNQVHKEFFPASFLENYKIYENNTLKLSDSIKVLGSATSLFTDDYYKILAAQIKIKSGKIINFQHGGCYDNFDFDIGEIFEKKYSDKIYFWHQNDFIGNTFLPKINYLKKKEIKGNKILILPTTKKFNDNMVTVVNRAHNLKYNPLYTFNFQFYNNLEQDLKNKTIVKLFPGDENKNIKKIWKLKTSNNVKIYSDGAFYKHKWFKDTRVVIMDDISTPLYETIYLNMPTILICEEFNEFNKKFKFFIAKLKKINFIFSKPNEASKFINDNYDKIDIWWSKILKSSDFKNFKNQLFLDKGFDPKNSLTRDLLKFRSDS